MSMKRTIVVVDNFYDDPTQERRAAAADDLLPHPALHKGLRGIARPISDHTRGVFRELLGLTGELDGYSCNQLCQAGDQLVYHADDQQWAATVYLTPDAPLATGLSLWRSRRTGDRDTDRALSIARMFDGALLDRTRWDEVDRVGNVFNRLVLWNARYVHSATDYFGTTLTDARLFRMFFFSEVWPGYG